MGNNFLGNGGTELNTTTGVMDLEYRQFDPVLGRMNQVDPLADNFSSHTPYNYSFNAPTVMNDPLGDAPLYTETERILHGLPMSGGRVMDYGTAGGHITRGSGGHWADGLDMGADLVWMTRSTFERFYNVNLSNPNDVWNVALGVSTAASGDVQYDRNSTESYRVFLNGGRVSQITRLWTQRQLYYIATANRMFGSLGQYSNGNTSSSGIYPVIKTKYENNFALPNFPRDPSQLGNTGFGDNSVVRKDKAGKYVIQPEIIMTINGSLRDIAPYTFFANNPGLGIEVWAHERVHVDQLINALILIGAVDRLNASGFEGNDLSGLFKSLLNEALDFVNKNPYKEYQANYYSYRYLPAGYQIRYNNGITPISWPGSY